MNIPPLTAKVQASDLPLEKVASSTQLTEADKVREASRAFEAVLLRQILSEARKATLSPDPESNSSINQIYSDMMNDQLAESISRSGEFGLARSLEGQLVHQTVHKPAADSPATKTLKTH